MGFFDFLKQANINQGIEEYKKTAGAVLLDVRTPQEYQEGHIPESKNVPLQQLNNVVSVVKNTEIPLFVYCYSGARSRQATGMLQRMGYSKVNKLQLQQEYEDWMNMQKLLCLKDPDTYPMRIVGFHIISET